MQRHQVPIRGPAAPLRLVRNVTTLGGQWPSPVCWNFQLATVLFSIIVFSYATDSMLTPLAGLQPWKQLIIELNHRCRRLDTSLKADSPGRICGIQAIVQ